MSKQEQEVQVEKMVPMNPVEFAKMNVRDGFVPKENLMEEALRISNLFVKGRNAEILRLRQANSFLQERLKGTESAA